MEDFTNKRLSIQTKLPFEHSNLNHHTSVQYNALFVSKKPLYRRGSSLSVSHMQNVKKDQIFQMVYNFIGKLVTNSEYVLQIFKDMKFQDQDKTISVTKISNDMYADQSSSSSVNSDQMIPDGCQENTKNQKLDQKKKCQLTVQKKKQGIREAKVSIMVGSIGDFSVGSGSRISCSSFINISSINFPLKVLSLELVKIIFQEPEPFLINLALCLMFKFLYYSKIKLSCSNACWILSIGTIIAYKIYYDEVVGGLIDSFSDIIEIGRQQIIKLERYFLDQINFQAIITNQQYHMMLTKIINV